jgi:hypothetical protein
LADNHDVALPILQRHGLCATFFIATGFLNGGRMWNDTIIETVRACKDLAVIDAVMPDPGSGPGQALIRHPWIAGQVRNDKTSAITTLINQIKYLPTAERVTVTEGLAKKAQVQLPNDLMMISAQVKAMRQAGMQIGDSKRFTPWDKTRGRFGVRLLRNL